MVAYLVAANKVWLVQHVRVILDGALERVLATTRVSVENVAPEMYRKCVTTVLPTRCKVISKGLMSMFYNIL